MDESTTSAETRLNLGAGRTHIPGFVNIDISRRADITLDLGRDRLPFADDSVSLVFSYHTLEHVTDYLFAVAEIHRVLRHGGRFLVGLPYVTLTEYHLVNPYHHHDFNEYSFDFFDPSRLRGSAVEDHPVHFRKVFHSFHYIGAFHLVPPPLRTWCRRHLLNVVRKIDFGLVAVKDPEHGLPTLDAVEFRRQFRQCLHSRVPYDAAPARATRPAGRPLAGRVRAWWNGHA
ncbi:MAG: class I SAM-dependent methyltransferase [Planctomycetota bacterium]